MKVVSLVLVGFSSATLFGCANPPQTCFGDLERLAPSGGIEPTAQWGLGAKAGPYVFISGMRGIDPEQGIDELHASVPLGRIASPQDIADVVVFLASDRARYMCGSLVEVNGGKPVG